MFHVLMRHGVQESRFLLVLSDPAEIIETLEHMHCVMGDAGADHT